MLFNLPSQLHLAEYFKCLRNIKPGDEVQFLALGEYPVLDSTAYLDVKTNIVQAKVAFILPAITFYGRPYNNEPGIILTDPVPRLRSFYPEHYHGPSVRIRVAEIYGSSSKDHRFRCMAGDMFITKIIKAH